MQGLEEFSTGWLMTLYFKPCSFATTTHFRCQILYNTFISAYNIYPLLSSHYDTIPYRDITGSHFSIWTIRNNFTIMEVTENHINKLHQIQNYMYPQYNFPFSAFPRCLWSLQVIPYNCKNERWELRMKIDTEEILL